MNNILFVSTSVEIQNTLSRYFIDSRLNPEKTFTVVEFFNKKIPTNLPAHCIGTTDLLDQNELDKVCERLNEYGSFDAVVSLSEMTIYAAADLRSRLKAPGPRKKDLERFRDKVAMKEALVGSDIRFPKLYTRTECEKSLVNFPIIAKPRAYYGSIGVTLIDDETELQNLLKRAPDPLHPNYDQAFEELREYDLQFEEFIPGETYHIDGVVKNGSISFSKTYRHINSCMAFIKGLPLGNISVSDQDEIEHWRNFGNKVIKVMSVPDGAFHLEAFLTPDGERIFLEIGARPPGGMISNTLEEVYGVDLRWEHIQAQSRITKATDHFTENHQEDLYSGDLIFPMKYLPEGQKAKHYVEAITELSSCDFPTLRRSKYPTIGSPAENEFAYENNLGSFIFSSDDAKAILRDIERAIRIYKVRISQ